MSKSASSKSSEKKVIINKKGKLVVRAGTLKPVIHDLEGYKWKKKKPKEVEITRREIDETRRELGGKKSKPKKSKGSFFDRILKRSGKKKPARVEKSLGKYFPPMPFSRKRAMQLAEQMAFLGYQITKIHPQIIADLAQAEMPYTPEEYSALAAMSAIYQTVMVFGLIVVTMYLLNNWGMMIIAIGLSLFVGAFMFMRSMVYPSYLVRRRVLEIEKNFLYALRHMLIQVKGGTPLFNSMVSISEAGYGEISTEFGRVVREINSGRSMTHALESMGLRNPSLYLRRMVWQIVNTLRTGSDTAKTLEVILQQFTAEQRILIQKFAKELGPWAMMYMMVTVVFPTLGITLLMILTSLSSFQINETILGSFVIFSIVVQYFFIQFLKTKRPVMRW